jgi:hypothetical protein
MKPPDETDPIVCICGSGRRVADRRAHVAGDAARLVEEELHQVAGVDEDRVGVVGAPLR